MTKEMLREPKMEKLLEPRLLWEQGITVGRGKERRGSKGEEGGRKQGRKEKPQEIQEILLEIGEENRGTLI